MYRFRQSAVLGCLLALISMGAAAQDWPAKPIRVIVPSAPGDGSDIAARTLGEKLAEALKQPVVVDNVTGAGGVIGSQQAARAAPDGYTFIMGNAGSHGINPAIMANAPYNPVTDFEPVSLVFQAPNIFVATPSIGVKSLADLIVYAKANAGKVNYASGGNGSSAHMNAEYLKLLGKFDAKHVPYRGASPALNDLVAGHVQFMSVNLPPALALVLDGKLQPLAVTTSKRSPKLPNVPTVAESGFAGYETVAWFGLLAPKGTPTAILDRMQTEIAKACSDASVRTRLEGLGGDVVCGSRADFGAMLARDLARWRQVSTEAGVRLEQ